jgi:hypothetical protein
MAEFGLPLPLCRTCAIGTATDASSITIAVTITSSMNVKPRQSRIVTAP